MAQSRLELQALLETIAERVYFQPPEKLQIEYPCIIYERSSAKVDHADDLKYKHHKQYQVTVVDRSPKGVIGDAVEQLKYCSFARFFTADGLNHDVYNLYF